MNLLMQDKIKEAHNTIQRAVDAYKLDAVFALVSGGDDSMAMLYASMNHPLFAGVIHIDTLTGVTDTDAWKHGKNESVTTRHVIETMTTLNIELIVKSPATHYDQLVTKHGFPGPSQHGVMYRYLKERPLRQAKKEAKKLGGERIGFITGERKTESIRRFRNVTDAHKSEGVVWIPAIKNWTKSDCLMVLALSKISRNPVSIAIGMSGECGCGAYSSPSEKRVFDQLYPHTGKHIDFLETAVQHMANYNAIPQKFCKWGHGNGRRISDKQIELPGFELCADCIGSQVNRELNMHKLGLTHDHD